MMQQIRSALAGMARVVFISTCAIVHTNASLGLASESDVDRVKRELPQALARMEEFFSHSSGTFLLRSSDKPFQRNANGRRVPLEKGEEQLIRENKIEFWSRGDTKKYVRESLYPEVQPGKNRKDWIACAGPSSGFTLERSSDDGILTVKSVFKTTPKDIAEINRTIIPFQGCSYSITNSAFSKIFADPSFSIDKVEPLAATQGKQLKIWYQYQPSRPVIFRGGWVTVDPDRNWAICAFSMAVETPKNGVIKDGFLGTVEYEGEQDGFAIPFKTTIVSGGVGVQTCQRVAFTHREVPEQEFTLAHYGLPDVNAPPKPKTAVTTSSWFYAVAVVALIVAVAMAWVARRPRAKPQGA